MTESSASPSIAVSIGSHARVFHAFITTAPVGLDGPSTFTLYTASLPEVALLAADPIACDVTDARAYARLVLIETTELGWQRARCRESQHLLAPADHGLVGSRTLQQWLWRRLQNPC